jgi:hypothetical protein
MANPVQLLNGNFQDAEGNVLANGYLIFELNQDSNVNGINICAGITIKIQLDANGNVVTSPQQDIWGNDALSPVNSYYRVTGYTAEGQPAWGPNNQQVIGSGTFDLSVWVPNQIYSWTPSSSTSILLETDGTPNEVQNILDLESGTNITLTDNGDGSVTIDAAAGGFILKVNGTQKAPTPHSTINLQNGSGITLTDDGSGDITFDGPLYKTPGIGWFLGGRSYGPVVDNSGGFWATGTVFAVEMYLDAGFVVNAASSFTVTGSNGAFTAGIYDSTGTKIIDCGANAFSLAASQHYSKVTLSGIQLRPGIRYYFVFAAPSGANGSVLTHVPYQWLTQLLNGIDFVNPQSGPTRIGIAANGLVGGNTLPNTLGALTPINHTNFVAVPAILFST